MVAESPESCYEDPRCQVSSVRHASPTCTWVALPRSSSSPLVLPELQSLLTCPFISISQMPARGVCVCVHMCMYPCRPKTPIGKPEHEVIPNALAHGIALYSSQGPFLLFLSFDSYSNMSRWSYFHLIDGENWGPERGVDLPQGEVWDVRVVMKDQESGASSMNFLSSDLSSVSPLTRQGNDWKTKKEVLLEKEALGGRQHVTRKRQCGRLE